MDVRTSKADKRWRLVAKDGVSPCFTISEGSDEHVVNEYRYSVFTFGSEIVTPRAGTAQPPTMRVSRRSRCRGEPMPRSRTFMDRVGPLFDFSPVRVGLYTSLAFGAP